MTQPLGDHAGMSASLQEQGRRGVAQVVEPEVRKSRAREQRVVRPGQDVAGVDRSPELRGEHKVEILP